ncbi:ATP-binding protein [Cnuibacter sp. UC19_7]|uniref:ATP-binding protein n=1 Tax=Cnuibacter sp. UC19_7 TaxID=3350166 RepID=UPI00366B27E3
MHVDAPSAQGVVHMSAQIAIDPEAFATTRAIGRAALWFASSVLVVTALIDLAFIPFTGRVDIVAAVAALVIMGLSIAAALSRRTLRPALCWTGVAAVALFGYASIVSNVSVVFPGPTPSSDYALLSMPTLAILLCGVSLRSVRDALIVGTTAFVLGHGLVLVAAALQGMPLAVDVPVVTSWIGLALLVIAFWHARGVTSRGATVMGTAGRDEIASATAGRFSGAAAEWLRETVLEDLRALAATEPGPLGPDRVAAIRRHLADLDDIGPILEESTLAAVTPAVAMPAMLLEIRQRAEQRGVRVALAGQLSAVAELSSPVSRRLQSVIDDCLDNVARHSGLDEAEVAVMDGESEVSVMVSDAGAGFDLDRVDVDGPGGLRSRLLERLTDAGGSVQIWARPGAGTAIFLTVRVRS